MLCLHESRDACMYEENILLHNTRVPNADELHDKRWCMPPTKRKKKKKKWCMVYIGLCGTADGALVISVANAGCIIIIAKKGKI